MSKPKTAPSEYDAIVRRFARIFAISEAKARAEIAARTKRGERPITCARALIKTLTDKTPRRIANEAAKGGFMGDIPYEAVLEAARQMRHDARFPGRAYKPLGGAQ